MAYVELHLSEVITPPRDLSRLRRLDPKPANVNIEAIEYGRRMKAEHDKTPAQRRIEARLRAEHEAILIEYEKNEALLFDSVNISRIRRCVCEYYGVTVRDVISERRQARIMLPRHVAIYLSRQLTQRSLPAIGKCFGNRDHTTILSACKGIEARMTADPSFAAVVYHLRAVIDPPPIANEDGQMALPFAEAAE